MQSDFGVRIERLEKENRRLKAAVLTFGVLVTALLLMGQGRPDRVVTAQKFILTDAHGKTKAELGLSDDFPHLMLYGTHGKTANVAIFATEEGGAVNFFGADRSARALLQTTEDGAVLNLFDSNGNRAHLGVGTIDVRRPEGDSAKSGYLVVYGEVPGPSLVINDKQGFSAVIGSTGLRIPETGESSRTSAASLKLFAKDGKQLWSAP
jgi:hypothetical protein